MFGEFMDDECDDRGRDKEGNELIEFDWHADRSGYRHMKLPVTDQPIDLNPPETLRDVLLPIDPWAEDIRGHRPMENDEGLFRTFADLPTHPIRAETIPAILAFAKRYGPLGGEARNFVELELPEGQSAALVRERDDKQYMLYPVDLLLVWVEEANRMRAAIELWELLVEGNTDGLKEVIVTGREGTVMYLPRGTRAVFLGNPDNPLRVPTSTVPGVRPKHLFDPLTGDEHLGKDLERLTSMQLQSFINRGIGDDVSVGMLWHPINRRLEMRQQPGSLLSALWLQLALAVDRNRRFAKCSAEDCGRWFPFDPTTKRAGKRYCSNTCRIRAYRHRTAERKQELTQAVDAGERSF